MILPPEKNQGLFDTKDGESQTLPSSSPRVYQPGSSAPPPPTFPAEKALTPPPIRLEYQPESSSSSRAIAPPTFPTPSNNDLPPPPIRLEYQPESSSSSRAIAPPTFPTPFNNDLPPPSYSSSDSYVISASSSRFAPTSSTTNAAMSVPMAPGSPPFSRAPSREVTYPSFQPMFLVATGKSLAKGFPYTSPPSNSIPHPFASHDVYEVDWMSFLEEAQMMAALSPKQVELSRHLPILSIVPIVKDLASYGVQHFMKQQNASKVIGCIDRWNRHFFEQRKMRIILMKGTVRVSGQNEYKNYDDHPSPSNPSISQILTGENDDVYRLFIVPLP